jgi:hypothetical protein
VIHVFIDTNVYLMFFSFAEDDLEELRKLTVAINNGDLKLWTTEQTQDELARNREAKVADSIAMLRKLRPSSGVPQMARNLPEFDDFLAARRELAQELNSLVEQLTEQYERSELAADDVLEELMDAADTIEITSDILEAARRRTDVGNPPGKRGSMGDAINWEALLDACPDGVDLYLVTQDGDFISKMDREQPSSFLVHEWQRKKSGEVKVYPRISSLFAEQFPDIKLASELEKDLRVRNLVESGNFQRTHAAIAALSGYTDFSEQQARDLLNAALENSQIHWIAEDSDVQEFFRELVAANGGLFEREELERFEQLFGNSTDEEEP